MWRRSHGEESIGAATFDVPAGEAMIPEGAEAWSPCGFLRRRLASYETETPKNNGN
jgi:hypothetical protein